MGTEPTATIEIFQDRQWAADPRLGTFTVYVDGTRVALVRPLSTAAIPVAVGTHSIRVRQWFYGSPVATVTLQDGQRVRFRADVSRGRTGLFRLLFRPWSSLVLQVWPG